MFLLTVILYVTTLAYLACNYTFQVLSIDDVRYGYNAANNTYEDLMAAGIVDPSKVFMP